MSYAADVAPNTRDLAAPPDAEREVFCHLKRGVIAVARCVEAQAEGCTCALADKALVGHARAVEQLGRDFKADTSPETVSEHAEHVEEQRKLVRGLAKRRGVSLHVVRPPIPDGMVPCALLGWDPIEPGRCEGAKKGAGYTNCLCVGGVAVMKELLKKKLSNEERRDIRESLQRAERELVDGVQAVVSQSARHRGTREPAPPFTYPKKEVAMASEAAPRVCAREGCGTKLRKNNKNPDGLCGYCQTGAKPGGQRPTRAPVAKAAAPINGHDHGPKPPKPTDTIHVDLAGELKLMAEMVEAYERLSPAGRGWVAGKLAEISGR